MMQVAPLSGFSMIGSVHIGSIAGDISQVNF
jgi:hypothetical protein